MNSVFRLIVRLGIRVSCCWRGFWLDYAAPGKLKAILANDPDSILRLKALSRLGATVGIGTYINPGVRLVCDHPEKARLVLGERVAVAPNVIFVCNSGPCHSRLREDCAYVRDRLVQSKTITVGDDSWIGAGAVLLPGVTLGEGVIIGANAVVTQDCPPYTVWAGVPARLIRTLTVEKA